MKVLFSKKRSAGYAKDRVKLLLVSERMNCSPQMIQMLRNDLIHSAKKYVSIEEDRVVVQVKQNPTVLYAAIPVLTIKDD